MAKRPKQQRTFQTNSQHTRKNPECHQVLGALMVLGHATPERLWQILRTIQYVTPASSSALRSQEDVLAALHVLHNHGLARPAGTWGSDLGDTWEVLVRREPEPANLN